MTAMKHMRRIAKWAIAVLIIVLVAIQLVPVDRSNPPVETEVPATVEVRSVLRRACYDCHSNETVWPWYSRIAPISWLIARDVYKGREELNLSTWNRYTTKQQLKKLKESWDEVAEGEMPPWMYLPPHPDARLSADDRAVLRAWSQSVGSQDSNGG
jgi:hypothetical protein